MAKRIDIYDYNRKVDVEIRSIEKSKISNRNKELIFQFKDFCFIEGLTKARVWRLIGILKLVALRTGIEFETAKKEELMKFVQKVQLNEKYSVWTKQVYKVVLKKFYKWLKGDNKTYPEEVSWITTNIKRSQMRLPSEEGLLTEDEIKRLVSCTDTPRDKAMVSVLYESGCRIGEIMSCRLNSITFDEYGCSLVVMGKTGSRKVRLIASTPYLANWLEHHPFKENIESPLWVNLGNKKQTLHMMYPAIRMMLRKLFLKAGVKKRFNPHLFRHSRATFLASYLTEFQMNQYLGWIQGSKMPATYVHMSGKDVDNAILAVNGIHLDKQKKESILQSKPCPRCKSVNGYNAEFCTRCGGVLDIQTAIKMEEQKKQEIVVRKGSDELMNALIKDPAVQELLIKKILEMGLSAKLSL